MKDDAKKKLAEQKRAEYDRRWEDKMWRKIARREERHVEDEAKRRRSDSTIIKDEARGATEGGEKLVQKIWSKMA